MELEEHAPVNSATHGKIGSFIWGIADVATGQDDADRDTEASELLADIDV